MQISLNWINELVDIETVKLDDLIDKLTLGGFEVEEVFEFEINRQKQTILDISATANRSDSLSIQGISNEIATLIDKPKKISNYAKANSKWTKTIEDKVEVRSNHSNFSIFLAIIVENLRTIDVPKWISQKLLSSGIVSSNNLSDFQSYILLETGYPFEFYDFDSLSLNLDTSKFNISLENSVNQQKFLASNDSEYNLNSSILTVKINQIPISIAGLIPTKNAIPSKTTKKLLIEGSIFNAAKIRQQSRNLGLRTERSARYEKSLRNTYLIESLYRLISLLRIANPNLTCKLQTIKKSIEQPFEPIILNYKRVIKILGHSDNNLKPSHSSIYESVSPKEISNYLIRLNFDFRYDKNNLHWFVIVPNSRVEDITREIDLIEEIGRLHGFNNFLTTLPKIKRIGREDSNCKIRKKITACFLNLGLSELIHYSLVNQKTFASQTAFHFGASQTAPKETALRFEASGLVNDIELLNPLLSDYGNLRSSLLPNLIKTVQENFKQKNLLMEGFEYGHVFSSDPLLKFKEQELIAGIFGGVKTKLSWLNPETSLTWFEAKGKIEQLFSQLNLITYWQKCSNIKSEKLFHPYRSADIYLSNGRILGNFGQIHPILANQLNLPLEIYLFEFNIERLDSNLQTNKLVLYKPYSLYPKIVKDLSFVIRRDIEFEKIQQLLYWNGTEFLIHINLLDEYRGQFIPENHTSLCLQLIFQSNKQTLETKKIETIMDKLQVILIQNFNAKIRT